MRTAVYSGTRNLYPDMVTAVKSLLIHDGADRVVLIIEDDEFPYPMPDCCEFMNLRDQQWFWPHGPNYNSQWTYMVLMRAALAKIFPEEDKVLSLDVDTIVDGDISGLWELPLDQYYLAAAEEPNTPKAEHYVQMGVVLFNLKKMREDRMDNKLIHAINTRKFDFVEQDCINELCQGNILLMDSKYNVNNYTYPTDDPRILHFAAISNWQDQPAVHKYRNMEFKAR